MAVKRDHLSTNCSSVLMTLLLGLLLLRLWQLYSLVFTTMTGKLWMNLRYKKSWKDSKNWNQNIYWGSCGTHSISAEGMCQHIVPKKIWTAVLFSWFYYVQSKINEWHLRRHVSYTYYNWVARTRILTLMKREVSGSYDSSSVELPFNVCFIGKKYWILMMAFVCSVGIRQCQL